MGDSYLYAPLYMVEADDWWVMPATPHVFMQQIS